MQPVPPRPVELTGDGLVLRPFGEQDLPDLLAAFADPSIARWNPGPAGGEEAAAAWSASRNDWGGGDHASWAVGAPPGGEGGARGRLLGAVSLHRIDPDQGDAEVGYWVAPWARGRRLAARAVGTAARWALGALGLHRLYLYHAVDNPASCRVAAAAGFRCEGTLLASYRYPDGAYHDEHLHAALAADLWPGRGR